MSRANSTAPAHGVMARAVAHPNPAAKPPPSRRRAVFAGRFFAAACFAAAVWAAAWSWSSFLAADVRSQLNDWQAGSTPFTWTAWHSALADISAALKLQPNAAGFHADAGRLHEWAAWQDPDEGEALRRQALAHYRQALRHRPTWGLAWAHLTTNGALIEGLSPDVVRAFLQATALGGRETEIQQRLLWLGFALWDDLSPEMKAAVREMATHAMNHGVIRERVIRLAIQYEWTAELQALSLSSNASALVDSLVGTPPTRDALSPPKAQ